MLREDVVFVWNVIQLAHQLHLSPLHWAAPLISVSAARARFSELGDQSNEERDMNKPKDGFL